MGKYDRYVPDGAAGGGKYDRYLPEKPREKQFSKLESMLMGVGAGGTWGLRDEAEGGAAARHASAPEWVNKAFSGVYGGLPVGRAVAGLVDAGIGVATENKGEPGDAAYDAYMTRAGVSRQLNEIAREDNPWSYGGGELGGALVSVPPVAGAKIVGVGAKAAAPAAKAGVMKTIGRGVGDVLKTVSGGSLAGGGLGAVSGAANSEGRLEERLSGAGAGAQQGFVWGAALAPGARYIAAPLVSVIGRKFFTSAENKALDMVLKRAKRSDRRLEDVRADFERWAKDGEVPETLAELMGPNERGVLSAAITTNKEVRSKAGQVLLGRGRDEVSRLEGRFAESMGANRKDFPKARAEAAKARAVDPEPYYDFAHFYELDGRKYRTFFDKPTAARFVKEIEESEVALESVKQAARYADTMRQPKVRDELRALAKAIENGEKVKRVSVQGADYVERMINRKYDKALAGHSDDIPGGLRTLRDSVRKIIDPSGIGEARATAAERIQRGRLLEEGRKFMHKNVDVEDIDNVLRGNKELDIVPASEEGQRAYTVGAARAVADDLRNTSDMKGFADATRRIARTPAIREKIDAVRPKVLTKKGTENRASVQTKANQRLDREIERTADRAEFTNDMLGNSRTAFRQGDVAEATAEDGIAGHLGDFIEDLIIKGPAGAQASAWQKLGTAANNATRQPGVLNPKIARFLGEILLSTDKQIPGQINRLAARQAQTAGRPLLSKTPQRMATRAGGFESGRAGAEDPYAQDFDAAYAADAMKADDLMFDIMEQATPEERAAIAAEYERLTRYMSPDEADLVRRVLARGQSRPAALPAPQ